MFDKFTKRKIVNDTKEVEETNVSKTNHVEEKNTEISWDDWDDEDEKRYFEKYEDIIYKDSTRTYTMFDIDILSKDMSLTLERLNEMRSYLLWRVKVIHKLIKKLENTERKDEIKWYTDEKKRLLFLLGIIKTNPGITKSFEYRLRQIEMRPDKPKNEK